LIEIIIAMAIVAIAVLAIATAMSQHIKVASSLEQRLLASWVAANQVATIQHKAKISRIKTGSSSDTVEMGGHKWRTQASIDKTDVNNVFLLTLTVTDSALQGGPVLAKLTTAVSDTL